MKSDWILKVVVQDARRLERAEARMLEKLRSGCTDASLAITLDQILGEERGHLRQLNALAGDETPGPEGAGEAADPGTLRPLPAGAICEDLRAFLRREESAATFYELLAERSPLPPIRRAFRDMAMAERSHAEKMLRHIRRICGQGTREAHT